MNYEQRQKELDNQKWYDSVLCGQDCCGAYDYCVKCRKEQPTPCARAEERWKKKTVLLATARCKMV